MWKISLKSAVSLGLSLSLLSSVAGISQAFAAPVGEFMTPDHESELQRNARFSEQIDRLLSRGRTGQRTCRYVSGISTPPPWKRVALTFDDGPDPIGTPYILKVLKKYDIRATFFMVGRTAAKYPELVQEVVDAGHLVVANHSWTHPDFHRLSVDEQERQVLQNEDLLGRFQIPKLFRYPYGNSTCETNDLLHSLGYKIVGWHVDSCDWAFNRNGSVDERDASICEVLPRNRHNFVGHVIDSLRARGGGILLMHSIQPNTIHQLERIVVKLRNEGFEFGNLDDADFQPSLR